MTPDPTNTPTARSSSPSSQAPEHSEWELAKVAAQAADDKLGEHTVVLEVGSVLGITDQFVITSGANARQVRAIADEVEAKVKSVGGGAPRRVEGKSDARWLLMDYGDFVVHVFLAEARDYYDLERLWSDVPRLEWRSGPSRSVMAPAGEAGARTNRGSPPG
ncbi:MAG: ribosome silencing factor [Acidimicrobiales bacterium]